MVDLIALLVRTLLPFLKESILQGLTPAEWFKRNKLGCIWLGVVLTLVFAILHLSSLVFSQSTMLHESAVNLNRLTLSVQTLTMERDQARQMLTELQGDHEELTIQHEELLEVAAHLEERKERYESWLEHCGIDINYSGSQFPACPVKRVVVRQKVAAPPAAPPPTPPVEERKSTLRERLKAIFTGGQRERSRDDNK